MHIKKRNERQHRSVNRVSTGVRQELVDLVEEALAQRAHKSDELKAKQARLLAILAAQANDKP